MTRVSILQIAATSVALLGLGSCSETKKAPEQQVAKKRQSDKAPDIFKAKFETSKGDFVVEVQS